MTCFSYFFFLWDCFFFVSSAFLLHSFHFLFLRYELFVFLLIFHIFYFVFVILFLSRYEFLGYSTRVTFSTCPWSFILYLSIEFSLSYVFFFPVSASPSPHAPCKLINFLASFLLSFTTPCYDPIPLSSHCIHTILCIYLSYIIALPSPNVSFTVPSHDPIFCLPSHYIHTILRISLSYIPCMSISQCPL